MRARLRGVLLTTAVLASYATTTTLLGWGTAGAVTTVRTPGTAPLDAVLGLAAAAGAWVVLSWLTATGTLALLRLVLTGPAGPRHDGPDHRLLVRLADRVTPALVRRLAAMALGVGLVGSPVGGGLPAYATGPGPARPAPAATSALEGSLEIASAAGTPERFATLDRPAAPLPGWTPDRPAAQRPARAGAQVRLVTNAPRAERAVLDEVVVRRGDTLWDIAARHLGPDASAAEVAAWWPRWYHANLALVGPQPDRIMPGQRLRPPASR